jgi:hypothetical protein
MGEIEPRAPDAFRNYFYCTESCPAFDGCQYVWVRRVCTPHYLRESETLRAENEQLREKMKRAEEWFDKWKWYEHKITETGHR